MDPALEAELARGVALHRAGRAADAEAAYRALLSKAPDHAHALNYLGTLLAAGGRAGEGIELLKRSVRQAPTVPELHLNLADALAAAGHLEAAESVLKRAVQQRRSPEALTKLGMLLLRQGKPQPAAHRLEQALKLDPGHLQARHSLAILRAQLGDTAAAGRLLRDTLALAPGHIDALNALAMLDQKSGDLASAATRLRRVVGLSPLFSAALGNLAVVLDQQGKKDEATGHFRQALALLPGEAPAWTNLANLAQDRGRPSTAERLLRRALCGQKESAGIWSNLGRALNAQGRTPAAIAAYRRALTVDPTHLPARSNLLFALSYAAETTNDLLFDTARRSLDGFGLKERERPPRREAAGRLKIAVASTDLRDHPVGRNVLGIFEHHQRVELHAFVDAVADDPMTAAFRRHADGWRSTVGLADAEVADEIRRSGMDALVVLAGHTSHNRPLLAACRGAPVQISFHDLLTSGLPAMDWWVTDRVLHPDATAEGFVERLWRLPNFYLHRPPADRPGLTPLPGDERGHVTFVSCNHPAKHTPEVVALWARVLDGVPGSRLLLKYLDVYGDDAVRRRYLELFEGHGIAPDRLEFRTGRLSQRDQLALLGEGDIALDPFPFNGSTTTFESLWMGVPVVTLAGDRFVGRVGASVLTQLGLEELIAGDRESYVSTAIDLAGDRRRLAALRRDLRRRLLASPLCDAPGYTRTFEAALIEMAG